MLRLEKKREKKECYITSHLMFQRQIMCTAIAKTDLFRMINILLCSLNKSLDRSKSAFWLLWTVVKWADIEHLVKSKYGLLCQWKHEQVRQALFAIKATFYVSLDELSIKGWICKICLAQKMVSFKEIKLFKYFRNFTIIISNKSLVSDVN